MSGISPQPVDDSAKMLREAASLTEMIEALKALEGRRANAVRLSCRYKRPNGAPCTYSITVKLSLETWGREVFRKHADKFHPNWREIEAERAKADNAA